VIENDRQLADAVRIAGEKLQEIQDYLSANPIASAKVRFPRGFLGTVGAYSARYPWMVDRTLRRNLAYHYVFGDVLRWIHNRTDVWGLAKEMLIKHAVVVMGAIAESLLAASVRQLGFPEAKYPTRLKRLRSERVIDDKAFDELEWLWSARNAIHIYEVPNVEIEKYDVADARRAYAAVKILEDGLTLHFEGLRPPF
jgi:hypothetical protein